MFLPHAELPLNFFLFDRLLLQNFGALSSSGFAIALFLNGAIAFRFEGFDFEGLGQFGVFLIFGDVERSLLGVEFFLFDRHTRGQLDLPLLLDRSLNRFRPQAHPLSVKKVVGVVGIALFNF